MKTLRAHGDFVVIEPMAVESQIGSIHIPNSVQLPASQGVIKSIGGKVKAKELQVGMTVMFQRMYGPTEFEGKEYQILREKDLIAVV